MTDLALAHSSTVNLSEIGYGDSRALHEALKPSPIQAHGHSTILSGYSITENKTNIWHVSTEKDLIDGLAR